ncbi:MAG: hypothetical protein ABSE56_09585 [Bryobacteraceae bacterium]|jgi:hypothetical protein
MKTRRLWIAAILAVSLAACHVRYIPVREARFRTETARSERLQLPLTAGGRAKLLGFLRAGGDSDRVGNTLVDPAAETHYGPLLDRLADPAPLTLDDLLEKRALRKWLSGPVLRQVIDAREESPPAISPVAVGDGRYWWIFYPRHKRLEELLVTLSAEPRKPKR